jgi:predicted metalloprotease with PDZ domain
MVSPISFEVNAHDIHAHLFAVKLTIACPKANQIVSLPVWIPGSYLVREFSKHLQDLHAKQANAVVALKQLDKCSWLVNSIANTPLVLHYKIYASDNSVRAAWLDSQRGFFNGTSLFLCVQGQEDVQHLLTLKDIDLPTNWEVATALRPETISRNGFGSYLARNYDELVDSPVELGSFWSGCFEVADIPHRVIVAGAAPSFEGARLLTDIKTICETAIKFWHGKKPILENIPHRHYLFLLNAVHEGFGGLEHKNSTALICKRADLPSESQSDNGTPSNGYTTLLGLISHEYFHTWNVKRLRPKEFTRYDYTKENYTELLWFFEGFTSYYDELLLCRAGLISKSSYLELLSKSINQLLQTPGCGVQNVARASFDAWVKFYRPDANSVNATVSYYTKGALIALCLDSSLRQTGQANLDCLMRMLWLRCEGGPLTEDDLLAALADLTGKSFSNEIAQWVHSTDDLPLKSSLNHLGVGYEYENTSLADQLGLQVNQQQGIFIKSVLRKSIAEQAGFSAGDEWLGVEMVQGGYLQRWRLTRIEDLHLLIGSSSIFQALISRDQRLLILTISMPTILTKRSVKLRSSDTRLLDEWLLSN